MENQGQGDSKIGGGIPPLEAEVPFKGGSVKTCLLTNETAEPTIELLFSRIHPYSCSNPPKIGVIVRQSENRLAGTLVWRLSARCTSLALALTLREICERRLEGRESVDNDGAAATLKEHSL